MTRIHADTVDIAWRRLAVDPGACSFLRIDVAELTDPDVGPAVLAIAIDDALAGLDGTAETASDHLRGVSSVTMDETSFRILAMSDVNPLVAIALAHALGPNMGVMFETDVDLGLRQASLDYVENIGPAPQIDLQYGLGGGDWMSWPRIIRFGEEPTLPDTRDLSR